MVHSRLMNVSLVLAFLILLLKSYMMSDMSSPTIVTSGLTIFQVKNQPQTLFSIAFANVIEYMIIVTALYLFFRSVVKSFGKYH